MSSLEFITEASPSNRTVYCAYVALEDTKGNPVGTYVQGLYQLAQADSLKSQIEAKAYADVDTLHKENPDLYKKLYHANGVKKTAFELAVIHQINKDDVQNTITAEYTWQNAHGQLPQYVFKKHVGTQWLANLKLSTSNFKMKGPVHGMVITVDNFTPKAADRWTHGAAQAIGLVVTASTLLGLAIALLPSSFLASLSGLSLAVSVAAIALISVFIAKTTALGNSSNFFGLAETLFTEVPALLSKQFLKKNGPVSWSKLTQSVGFAAAIGGLAFMGASSVYTSTMALPVVAGLGVGASVVAGLLAGVSFVGGCIGASIPVRLFSDSGFGVWDNTISADAVNSANLQPLKAAKLAPAQTVDQKEKGITPLAPTKAERKEAKILDLTEKLAEARRLRA